MLWSFILTTTPYLVWFSNVTSEKVTALRNAYASLFSSNDDVKNQHGLKSSENQMENLSMNQIPAFVEK